MQKSKSKIALLLCSALVTGQIAFATTPVYAQTPKKAKNVIMLIPDGMSVEAETLGRWYYDIKKDGIPGNDRLTLDSINTGTVRTYWQNGPITDSAPAGTAYSTGKKSDDAHVGVLGNDQGNRPIASVLEAAKLAGKSVGAVATCEIMHATPADFAAHDPRRSNYNSLMKQMVYSGLDVVLGGGDKILSSEASSPDGKKIYRKDGKDLREELKKMGYTYVNTKEEMDSVKSGKLWGAFAASDLDYDLDRRVNSEQPTLEEMTKKSIELLSKDKDGFFLMIEGSKIDWAAHANDPAGLVGDIVAFDKAVKVALDFAKKDGNTVIVSASDHGTGGVSIGYKDVAKEIGKDYAQMSFSDYLANITKVKGTTITIGKALTGAEDSKIIADVKTYFGYNNLTTEEITKIKAGKLNEVVSARCGIGWTSLGHIGGDVGLYCYAPNGIEKLTGNVDNTEVGQYLARVMGVDLNAATNTLFKNAKTEVEKLGGSISIDDTDKENPIVLLTKNGYTLKLNGFTNSGDFNGTKVLINGVVIPITNDGINYETKDVYVSKDVLVKFDAYTKAGKVVDIKPVTNPQPAIKTKVGIVTSSTLNIRNNANSKGKVLKTLKRGSKVTVIGITGKWYKVKYGNITGYIYADYLKVNR